jgi:hypothetical protein
VLRILDTLQEAQSTASLITRARTCPVPVMPSLVDLESVHRIEARMVSEAVGCASCGNGGAASHHATSCVRGPFSKLNAASADDALPGDALVSKYTETERKPNARHIKLSEAPVRAVSTLYFGICRTMRST